MQTITPESLNEALEQFKDEANAIAYMVRLRWPDGVVTCPNCGGTDVTWMPTRSLFQCRNRHPKRQFSVKAGTIMEGSYIPVGKWLMAKWLISKRHYSSHELARNLAIAQKSAWFMLKKLGVSEEKRFSRLLESTTGKRLTYADLISRR